MTAKKFKNFTEQIFVWKWDGIEHTFLAGMEIFLEDYKADHFAKHLVDQEMNRLHLLTNNALQREQLTALCFPTDEVVTPIEALNLNEKADVKAEKEKEVEFPDLNTTEEKEEKEEEKVEKKRGRPLKVTSKNE